MALEAVVFPQGLFPYAGAWSHNHHNYGFQAAEEEQVLLGIINNNTEQSLHATNWDSLQNFKDQWDSNSNSLSSPEACTVDLSIIAAAPSSSSVGTTTGRRKRRRTKSAKNKEEIENQRMTHIAVERNRRKQMNEYLAVLRSLMPSSYVQRGDQASIIGGAINFVKELEQLLQSMEGQRKRNENIGLNGSPFAEFFTFPQYTTQSNAGTTMTHNQGAVADIEVTMVDSHANLKILSKKRNGLLIKVVVGLQSLSLTILHLNVTTLHDMVLYSLSLKVEDGCQLNTVDEIAAAVHQLLRAVQEEAVFN
ncbi:hypothetical protein VNO77_10484 [Canavalia gladiata]|uniref:BHLH domain-containing protein n=1 Tax=Canavalia gladiata TaxID=3824 RepID=A0AAN9ME51_CANGL